MAASILSTSSFLLLYMGIFNGLRYYGPTYLGSQFVDVVDLRNKDDGETKPMSALQKRFSINGPKVIRQDQEIFMEYKTSALIKQDRLKAAFYEHECNDELETDDSPLLVHSLKSLGTSDDDLQTWRLSLKVSPTQQSIVYACVRMMLFNLPPSHPEAAEANFVETKLGVQLDGHAIAGIQASKKHREGIKVQLGGSAPAKIEKDDL